MIVGRRLEFSETSVSKEERGERREERREKREERRGERERRGLETEGKLSSPIPFEHLSWVDSNVLFLKFGQPPSSWVLMDLWHGLSWVLWGCGDPYPLELLFLTNIHFLGGSENFQVLVKKWAHVTRSPKKSVHESEIRVVWWSGTTFFLTFWVQVGPLFVTKSRSSPRAVKNFPRKILKKGNSCPKKSPFRCKSILTRVALKKSPKVLKVDDQVERGVFKMEYRAQERLRNCRKVVFWKVTFFGGAITGEGLGTNGTFGAPCPAGQFWLVFREKLRIRLS